MSASASFEVFWNHLENCKYELPAELKDVCYEACKLAGFFNTSVAQIKAKPKAQAQISHKEEDADDEDIDYSSFEEPLDVTEKPKKPLTAYNLYVKETNAKLKADGVDAAERSTSALSKKWKAMTAEQKKEWEEKAGGGAKTAPKKKAKASDSATGPKKLSGYQQFIKETMKTPAVQKLSGKDRLTDAASKWKSLSQADKDSWSAKAKQAALLSSS